LSLSTYRTASTLISTVLCRACRPPIGMTQRARDCCPVGRSRARFDVGFSLCAEVGSEYHDDCRHLPSGILLSDWRHEVFGTQNQSAIGASATMFDRDLEEAHIHCTGNEEALRGSAVAGCFYCCQIFRPAEIEDFLDGERTALCPRCGIDSVIGDRSGIPITDQFLRRMHAYWFERTVPFPPGAPN